MKLEENEVKKLEPKLEDFDNLILYWKLSDFYLFYPT